MGAFVSASLRAGLAGLAFVATGAIAHAAADPVAACRATGTGLAGLGALSTPAANAEAMLFAAQDRIAVADRAIVMLDTAAASSGRDTEASLAAYCVATGEAYRLGRTGNPYQARALLEDALRHAEAARSNPLVALAAYRLALIAGEGNGSSGGRGLHLRSIALSPLKATAAQQAEGGDRPCDRLGDARAREQGPTYFSAIALECARDRALEADDPVLAARAAYRLARVWLNFARRSPGHRADALANARAIALAAIEPATRIGDHRARVALLGRLAEAALDAGLDAGQQAGPELARAAAAMEQAAVEPEDGAAASALRARLALLTGDHAGAVREARRAILLEQQARTVPWRLADWYVLLAIADPAAATAHLAAALRALDAVRPLLPTTDALTEDANFALRIRPVFEATIGAELDDMRDGRDAPDTQTITRVQGQVEAYRQAELQSLLGSECVPDRPPVRPDELAAGEVLLYPVLLPDRIELLYAVGGAAAAGYHRLPPIREAARADVLALVDAMVDAASTGANGDWRAPARRLYDLLIRPVEPLLNPRGTLVIVPDGQLSALPFAALVDGQGHFLAERSRLAVVPSLAFAQPGAGPMRRPSVVAVTLERAVTLPMGTYEALTGTGQEAKAAVDEGHGGNLLIRNFRRADLERALSRGGIDVLHLATHASFNGRSDRSYIVADGEMIPIGDLRAMIAKNETRGNQLDLIVLSACETAVGDDQADMGLAGAAVQAGARSALASLWQVNDAGTAELMKAFYRAIRAGEGKAQALHDAQLSLIARSDELADPAIWAAFTLLGAWR